MSVTKKLAALLWMSIIIISWCSTQNRWQWHSIDYVIEQAIQKNQDCGDINWRTFISYDLLWATINDDENFEYYLAVNGQWYFINERWDLSSSCRFTGVPIKIEIGENKNWYFVISYQKAEEWAEYESSVKAMFSEDAYKNRKLRQRTYWNWRWNTLNLAEEYFWVKVDSNNNFDCKFCDITRYYHESELNKQWKNVEIYSSEPIDKKRFIFKNDWTLQKMWSKDEWKYERHFWKDNLSVIINMGDQTNTIERIIIERLKDNEMVFYTEYIQI